MSSAERPDYFSVDEYLVMEEQALTKSEYIDGWIRSMTGATFRHIRIATNCLVNLAIQLKGKRCLLAKESNSRPLFSGISDLNS